MIQSQCQTAKRIVRTKFSPNHVVKRSNLVPVCSPGRRQTRARDPVSRSKSRQQGSERLRRSLTLHATDCETESETEKGIENELENDPGNES